MAYLLVYDGNALREQRELKAGRVTIGRAKDNDIVLADAGVSGYHAVIEKKGEAHVLVDNGSSNGVFVDGKRTVRHNLKYWEDIQILDYVLKYRPRERLPGEQGDDLAMPDAAQEAAATTAIDVSSIRDSLARQKETELRKRTSITYFLVADICKQEIRFPLTNAQFCIGKSDGCDLHTPGWFAPRLSARIKRHSDGFYLLPEWRSKAKVNGSRVTRPTQLQDGDKLAVRGISLLFSKLEIS
jgi:pSer/pThr/pTyr-binding forkhead associated (FHA) protein